VSHFLYFDCSVGPYMAWYVSIHHRGTHPVVFPDGFSVIFGGMSDGEPPIQPLEWFCWLLWEIPIAQTIIDFPDLFAGNSDAPLFIVYMYWISQTRYVIQCFQEYRLSNHLGVILHLFEVSNICLTWIKILKQTRIWVFSAWLFFEKIRRVSFVIIATN